MRRFTLPLGAALALVALLYALFAGGGAHNPARRVGGDAAPAARVSPSPVAVATQFLTGLSLRVLLDDRRRNAFVGHFAARNSRAGLRREYGAESQRLREAFSARPRVTWTALIAHRIVSQRPGAVSVDIWAVSLGGAGRAPVAVGWRVLRVGLTRENGLWRIVGVAERPAPPLDSSAKRLAASTTGYREYVVVP
jgi:hypothetical protein